MCLCETHSRRRPSHIRRPAPARTPSRHSMCPCPARRDSLPGLYRVGRISRLFLQVNGLVPGEKLESAVTRFGMTATALLDATELKLRLLVRCGHVDMTQPNLAL